MAAAAAGADWGRAAPWILRAHAFRLSACSHIEIYTCLRQAALNNTLFAFYRQLRVTPPFCRSPPCNQWHPTTPEGRGRPAATADFYNLFIPLSLCRSLVSEVKINFTLYLNVKSFGSDRISFPNSFNKSPFTAYGAGDMAGNYGFMRRVIVFYSVLTAVDVQGNNRFNWKSVNKLVLGSRIAGGPDKLDRGARHIPQDRPLVPEDDRLFLSAAGLVFIIIYLPKGLSSK